MNVLMIGLYPPHVGGIASYVYHLKKALEHLDTTVYVVTYGKSSQPDVYGTHTTRTLRGVSFLISGTRTVRKIIKEKNIDVLHAHYLVPPGLVGVFSKKRSGLPLVVTCHGSDIFVFSTGWKQVLSRYVVHTADCVTCNSKATLTAVQKLSSTPARYVPSGVDLETFKPLNMEKEAVTYVGALTWTKGVDIFLRAMKGIPEPVWIIGDGPERKSLEALAAQLDISCTFWGFRTDTPELMNRSKIVVLPSRTEGFGLTLLEAMACGTPVIGRNVGGIPDLLNGENGLLVTTEKELHRSVVDLLHNKSLWNNVREKGLKTASQWSWEKTARSYHKIYSHL
jgi:glycosyltransferase involved in cell wall biosynthesis